jgi:hypothetical protein
MATYEEIAPMLSGYVTENDAKNFAENLLKASTPVYRELDDLTANERSNLFTWLKWAGRNRKPVGLSDWINWSPGEVASYLRMNKSYILSLIKERNAIISEVSTYGNDSFIPHIPAVINNIFIWGDTDGNSDGYEDGVSDINYIGDIEASTNDVIITGSTLLSLGPQETVVEITRSTTTVSRTKTQIEDNGGSVTDNEIFITDGTLPAVLKTGDQVKIIANALTSEGYIIE